MEKIIKTFIADDSLNVRKALVAILSQVEGIEITGQAENVHDTITNRYSSGLQVYPAGELTTNMVFEIE